MQKQFTDNQFIRRHVRAQARTLLSHIVVSVAIILGACSGDPQTNVASKVGTGVAVGDQIQKNSNSPSSTTGETGLPLDSGNPAAGPETPPPAAPGELPPLHGVNLSGAEWGESALPGVYGQNYMWPTGADADHFLALGMNMFRIPFRWERVQPQAFGEFDATEIGRLDALVSYVTEKGAYALIDPHNYARYFGQVIGAGVSVETFADLWTKLASRYKDNPHVIFNIMNEPNTMSTDVWLQDANAAIAAIRSTGAQQWLFVPGNAWTGAHSWNDNWYGTSNAEAMKGVVDPLNRYMIEVHQYLDPTSGGTQMENCVSPTIGSERMAGFTQWARQNKVKAFLGEVGAGTGPDCLAALDDILTHLDNNSDVYQGFTYWAAGPWWGDTVYDIKPDGDVARPQTGVLTDHVTKTLD